ncbi:GNAT family N-acetyltransferase [Ligilactobacillus apodemi]|uniref:Acetyltransferase, GNAT family n=1 Tax=Ligilactobacillus apodemi DSM 16634 = JCM 16172 TaxID=1423724 RepID=A0A0R1U736_9LACO|nr:GNAT family N-acetyltransferase [Ligilactobacillus apodemi]KRL87080.1 acetyltransferase, GNAT family [Ligilactobacillus apodemi DSM 16634 = JCM 16172]MCR1901333.1 GNAT family N-acetyltransferase [Ligilactobacillus apodemi]
MIRKYQFGDQKQIAELFYTTVQTVNAKDYSQEQLAAWTKGNTDPTIWQQRLAKKYSLVAVEAGRIIGFGEIDESGYLGHLFVSADHLRREVATALCDRLEKFGGDHIITHASLTARPFFEQRGYVVIKKQQVWREGVGLTNFVMEKIKDVCE